MSNASTIITMPSSSQTSIISGEGGLCEVRKALTPMLFMMRHLAQDARPC